MRDAADEPGVNLSTSTDWWMSTKSPSNMLSPSYQRGELRELLLERGVGIDPALIVEETKAKKLGVSVTKIEAFQRKLGIRKFAPRSKPRR